MRLALGWGKDYQTTVFGITLTTFVAPDSMSCGSTSDECTKHPTSGIENGVARRTRKKELSYSKPISSGQAEKDGQFVAQSYMYRRNLLAS
jgi:hypothetical protein